jgi:hypothetical protein
MEAPMPAILEEWTVLPHGPLVELDEGLWTVTGDLHMRLTPLERRMTVVRLNNGDLVVYSAIALDEAQMTRLEEAGRPAWLIVPGAHHRMDAKIWKQRYPQLTVVAPFGARSVAEEVVPVDMPEADFRDEDVTFVTLMSGYEAALIVRRPAGTTLIVNDIIGNMPKNSGLVLRITQFAGDEPHVPLPIRFGLKDKPALRDQLLSWAGEPNLRRILMSHGEPVEVAPADALRRLASSLAWT